MGLQLINRKKNNLLLGSSEDANLACLSRPFFRILITICLPLGAQPSLACFTHYSRASSIVTILETPLSILETPPTGTGFDKPAENQMYLGSSFEGIPTAGSSLTTPTTPWVQGLNVMIPQIPFVGGEVTWNSVLHTRVESGIRYFAGNGLPNHPTGAFPVTIGQDAYAYYAALPDPSGEYSSAAEIPIAEYELYMALPANPIYSNEPKPFSEVTIGIASVTGSTFHANIALGDNSLLVDPVAALPMDQCFGHPYDTQYHYHGYSWKCFPNQGDEKEHSPLFGYALDGFGIFGPRGDGGELLTNEQLDVCHGHTGMINWDGIQTDMYHYHLNNEYPYGPGCFRGTQIGTFSSNGEPVPGPAPLLGAMAAFRWSRRLRKQCRPRQHEMSDLIS